MVASVTNKLTPSADAAALTMVDNIIAYLEDQADYLYGDEEGTVAILTAMANGKFKHKHGEKRVEKPAYQCYKYVKVALVRTQWAKATPVIKDPFEGRSASTAGQKLLDNGFTDVTDKMPDSRWASPGDVSVYAWTAARLASVRSKPGKENNPNDGHIDVRSYDNYLTDHIPQHFRPNWSIYDSPRVYRLYHDPVPILRMKAFLSCLREYEGQEDKDEAKRYQLLNCALPGTNTKHFTSFETHPWADVSKEERKGKSTAAGAYQIQYTAWVELLTGKNSAGVYTANRKMFSLRANENKFTPALQDRMAVALIELREALGHVRKGEIAEAIDKLNTEWSSLPGGTENEGRRTADKRPMDTGYFNELFDSYLVEEKKKAGVK
jgi:muramidase (phage lysozyme)